MAHRKRTKTKRPELRPIHLNIAALRDESGLSQSQLAAKCGVVETAVSHWERGLSSPSGKRLPLVAEALGVSVSDLFNEERKAS